MTPPLTPAEVAALIDEMQVRSRDYLCSLDDCRLLIKAADAMLVLQRQIENLSEHATYEQRRADGAVAELVEVHAKLADFDELRQNRDDYYHEAAEERTRAERAEQALAEALCGRQLL
jgi:hypothetical protein